jgi:hypothetical protein
MSLISSQFAVVRPLLASSPALHLLYATGRRNVLALHATLKLYPLHDVIMLAWQFGNSLVDPTYDAGESIEFDLTLGRGSEGVQDGVGVWAVVDKGVMGRIRERRFDMVSERSRGTEEQLSRFKQSSCAHALCSRSRPTPACSSRPPCPSRTRSSRSTAT